MSSVDCFAISERGPGLDLNEDYALLDAEAGIYVIADGLGGRPAGDRASRTAAETFRTLVRATAPGRRADEESLRAIVTRVNASVRAIAAEDPSLEGLGSTLSALVVDSPAARIAHVGDTRIYRHRKGRLEQMTSDHTLAAELAAESSTPPAVIRRFRHVLSRAIGTEESVEPDLTEVDVAAGDRYILATDGLTGTLEDEKIASLVQPDDAARTTCERLIAEATRRLPKDNLTVAVIRFEN